MTSPCADRNSAPRPTAALVMIDVPGTKPGAAYIHLPQR